jgi:hypothetical protein
MNILPEVNLTDTEMDIVQEMLTQTTIKKYFRLLGSNAARDILTGHPLAGQSASEYLVLEAHLKGQLSVIETILSIERPPSASPVA